MNKSIFLVACATLLAGCVGSYRDVLPLHSSAYKEAKVIPLTFDECREKLRQINNAYQVYQKRAEVSVEVYNSGGHRSLHYPQIYHNNEKVIEINCLHLSVNYTNTVTHTVRVWDRKVYDKLVKQYWKQVDNDIEAKVAYDKKSVSQWLSQLPSN